MQSKQKNIVEQIFYITIGIYFILSVMTITMLQYQEISSKAKFLRYICYFIIILVILCNVVKIEKGKVIRSFFDSCWHYMISHLNLAMVLFITFVVMVQTGENLPLILVFLVWAGSFYDFKKILRIYIVTTGIVMLIVFIGTCLGYIPQIVIERGERIRYAMGYIYPLETMSHFLFLTLSIFYLYNTKINYVQIALINIINFGLYMITDSRTSFYLVLLVSFIWVIYKKMKISELCEKITSKIYYLFLIFCSLGSITMGLLYKSNGAITSLRVNEIFNGRVGFMNDAFNKYGFTLFGKKIEWVGFGATKEFEEILLNYNFVDNSYGKILLDYGIIFLVLVLIGYAIIYKTANEQKDYTLIIVISIILILSVMEPRLVSIEVNPFVLLLARFFIIENTSQLIKNEVW